MSSYSELIKNFEKTRAYMREFYVYGFKSRSEYDKKSLRLYDDERRRMESWLGEYMRFVYEPGGKKTFISIDSRESQHNPFYKTLKSKSFTDGDITLHFIIFDILYSHDVVLSLSEIMEKIDFYLSHFENPMVFDESTVRKKLNEYIGIGLISGEKCGKKMLYRRMEDTDIHNASDALDFYSEVAPCGVVGSYILDKFDFHSDSFYFKHHYITGAIDSNVLASIFDAMHRKRIITVTNVSKRSGESHQNRIIPLRIFISVQNGRQHLLAYHADFNCIKSFRVDYLSDVKIMEESPRFDELRSELDAMQTKMWGVSTSRNSALTDSKSDTERVEFVVKIGEDEGFIVNRLYREKRIGELEKIDDRTYRFSAEVYDLSEMIPWIRTFICRIESIKFSDKNIQKLFMNDLNKMYSMYLTEEE